MIQNSLCKFLKLSIWDNLRRDLVQLVDLRMKKPKQELLRNLPKGPWLVSNGAMPGTQVPSSCKSLLWIALPCNMLVNWLSPPEYKHQLRNTCLFMRSWGLEAVTGHRGHPAGQWRYEIWNLDCSHSEACTFYSTSLFSSLSDSKISPFSRKNEHQWWMQNSSVEQKSSGLIH